MLLRNKMPSSYHMLFAKEDTTHRFGCIHSSKKIRDNEVGSKVIRLNRNEVVRYPSFVCQAGLPGACQPLLAPAQNAAVSNIKVGAQTLLIDLVPKLMVGVQHSKNLSRSIEIVLNWCVIEMCPTIIGTPDLKEQIWAARESYDI